MERPNGTFWCTACKPLNPVGRIILDSEGKPYKAVYNIYIYIHRNHAHIRAQRKEKLVAHCRFQGHTQVQRLSAHTHARARSALCR